MPDDHSPSQLCDFRELDAQLENAKNRLPTLKNAIEAATSTIIKQFWAGEKVTQLVRARSKFIDEILIRVWNEHFKDDANIALIAVGGYGRQELHPGSDIDILILLQNHEEANKEEIERLITEFWDLGLEIGHSVRDLSECLEEGKKDITIATNLMESRRITGNNALYEALQELSSPTHIWPSRDFFEAKWKEQKQRHIRFHGTAYNLEPNIKEGPGNLRDIQTIGWVTKRHFNADSLHELVTIDFLNEKEYEPLIEGQNFLWSIRFALHAITGRREDRLVFEHQPVIAERLGFKDEQPNLDHGDAQRAADGRRLGVELFMKKYFRTINELSRLNEMLLQLYQEAILYANEPGEPIPINRRFQSRKGFLEVTKADVFLRYPYALLEIFLVMQQHPELKGVRASTVRLIRQHHFMIDFKFRHDIRCRTIFMEIMRHPMGITHELRRMNQYGVLAAYIPEFDNIVGQMQYDLFHVYTVDQHTLFVVRNLRRFAVPEFKNEFPLCSRIIGHIPKPELLYIAGLFHDVAKGRGGDHSVLGAEDVVFFCERHDLSKSDTDLVSWLIKNHLYMSMTAQHKDIYDPEVINEFASIVENRVRLDYLYLLTVADMRGTNPKLWNSWKDALLIELYKQTRNAFLRGLENPMDKPGLIRETKALAQKKFDSNQYPKALLQEFWKNMREDYFIRYNTEEIHWHAQNLLTAKPDQDTPIILTQSTATRGSTDIFIHTPVRPYLITVIAGTLDQLGLNIVEARIVPTKDAFTMDTYGVLEYNNDPISDPQRLVEVKQRLTDALEQMKLPLVCKLRDASRQIEHFSIPPKVSFSDDTINKRTIMEVVATDRPGLLSRIAKAITDSGVRLQNAKISTIGAQAEDVFFITDTQNLPLQAITKRDEIRNRIIEYLEVDN